MENIGVLIITALKEEYEAARNIALKSKENPYGVNKWEENEDDPETPYIFGEYVAKDFTFKVALARGTRMGSTSISPIASSLVTKLKPYCLAMCGVCAGNPSDVILGDVIIAEITYAYDEGKQKPENFEPDHRQYSLDTNWLRTAQDLTSDGLLSYGEPSEESSCFWVLEQLYQEIDVITHHAKSRYFPNDTWETRIKKMMVDGFIKREGAILKITDAGKDKIDEVKVFKNRSPDTLPFQIRTGPMPSANVVVKDGITWDNLKKWGVRTVVGLEMEGATIGSIAKNLKVPRWIVVKGVMDYANPRKNDLIKSFSAKASAEVLFKFLQIQLKKDKEFEKHLGKPILKPIVNEGDKNIFITVGDLPNNHITYIKRKSDITLQENLFSKKSLINISGGFQSGKSSLLNQVKSYIPKEWKSCFVDLTGKRIDKLPSLTDGFFRSINNDLSKELTSWDEIKQYSEQSPLIILIDEFGALNNKGDTAETFISQLLNLAINSNVYIVASLLKPLGSMKDFLKLQNIKNPKYLNNWINIRLEPFTDDEIKELLGLLPTEVFEITEKNIETIKVKTEKHPQPIQCLCKTLLNNYNNGITGDELAKLINQDDSYRDE